MICSFTIGCTEALMLDQPSYQQLIARKVYETYELISTDFRCEDMLPGAEGVLSEARWLLDLGLLPNTSSDTRAIGYKQAMEYLSNVVDEWV
ncbi:tRNA dimethylallyltransferase 9-like [Raphanus sativus]|uniref:tRNA dimethylallyltransferase 9-like n=1 Tax=Raphanus sativus TaxID=3726 RepID=A0A9W3D957_RAPSA|nr:tRNA dimethylallyltransferase 9-like [Raphanus sativus]XP_056860380.1 tRNA dimethylallyltransferase 9-like [Raphanus sativus]